MFKGDRIHTSVPGREFPDPRRTGPVPVGREVVGTGTGATVKNNRASRIARRLVHYLGRILGRENARTSHELCRLMHIESSGTNQPLREAAKILLVRHSVPIISCSRGFFVAVTRQELYDYRANLEARMAGLARDIEAVNGILRRGNILENVKLEPVRRKASAGGKVQQNLF